MNPLISRFRQRLQAFNDYQIKALAKVRDHKERKNEALFARIGIKPTIDSGPRNKKRIILHSIVSFALFAAISYWLIVMCFEEGKRMFFGAIFLPFLAPIIYLVTVHFLSKQK